MRNSSECIKQQPTKFLGKHLMHIYESGAQYELYIKNECTIDYRVHSGIVGGRWVRDQKAYIGRLADDVCMVSWEEPTGTAVSLAVNFAERRLHGAIFFPQWIAQDPQKIACFQNEYLDLMRQYRDAGPIYPQLVIDQFAEVVFVEECGLDNQKVIACAPSELPDGYASRRN